jgi:recombination endonuclease VII
MTAAERQQEYRDRRAQGVPLRKRRLVTAEGRECAYSGGGNCGHAFKEWHEFGPGTGPHGKERRCKSCMVAKASAYAKAQPDPAKRRRTDQQRVYQQTDAGKETCRKSKIKYRYGITAGQYDWLLAQQEGLCYFCGFNETVVHHATHEVMRLGVEHDHACDQGHDPKRGCPACIRGLACYNCNIFIERAERSTLLRPRIEDLLARRPLQAVTPGS